MLNEITILVACVVMVYYWNEHRKVKKQLIETSELLLDVLEANATMQDLIDPEVLRGPDGPKILVQTSRNPNPPF